MKLIGPIVRGDGICSDPSKVDAVLNAPPPTNKKELASFHRFVQWYQRYIPAYAIIATPLLKMLRKQASWVWENEQEYAYRQIVELLSQQFLLFYPDPTKNYQIRTDASSKKALGAILLQDGLPIHYWSKTLSE